MLNSSNMDCSNMGLLDNNFIEQNYSYATGRRNSRRSRNENYSNAVSAETVQAGIGAATAIGTAVASKQPNVAKQAARAQKKEFKSVCGRKPLLKKKQAVWQDCVNKYTATKSPAPTATIDTTPSPAADYGASRTSSGNDSSGEKKFYQKPLFIGTAVVVVVLGGFLLYKKFSSKAPIAVPVG